MKAELGSFRERPELVGTPWWRKSYLEQVECHLLRLQLGVRTVVHPSSPVILCLEGGGSLAKGSDMDDTVTCRGLFSGITGAELTFIPCQAVPIKL